MSAEENFNDQVEKLTHSIDTSQLHSWLSLSLPNAFMNKMAMVARMEVMHGLSDMAFHSPGLS